MFSLLTIISVLAIRGQALVSASEIPQELKTVHLPLTLVHGDGGQGAVYLANISIGNPPQTVTVQVDSGSSDLWIFADQLECNVENGCHGGSYSPNASSTFKEDLPDLFEFSYGSGNSGTGDYFKDDVHIGGVTVKNFRIGLAKNATGGWPLYGLMGMSFSHGEFLVEQGHPEEEYPVLLEELALQGHIDTPAFSQYLNDVRSEGELLFGGIDDAKHIDEIKEFDLIASSDGTYIQWYLHLTGLGLSVPDSETTWFSNSSVTGSAFLDSGSPKAFLPASAAIPLLSSVGASYKSDLKQTIIPCSAANSPNASTITVDFAFGGSNEGVIRVPIIQLIERYPDPNPPLIGNETACSFGVSPGPDGFMVLGDAFLRGAYAVLNMEKKTVGLSNAKFNVTESVIRPVS